MRPRNLDLDLLRTFTTVADLGTVTAAAQRLAYSQSAVSMQLERLERQLGLTLTRKAGRGLVLTGEGERLLGYARRLLALNDQTLAELRSRPVSGVIRLGIPTDYAFMLTPVLSHFAQLYPDVELQVQDGLSVDLIASLRAGELDLCVVTRQRNSPGGEVLRREPLLWVAGRAGPPIGEGPIPLALYPEGKDVFRERALAALETAGMSARVAYTSRSASGVRPAVDADLAIMVVTRSQMTPELRVLGPQDGLPELPSIEIALHRPRGRPPEAVSRLTALLEQQLKGGS
jgi:DNA-binding transcriptional LysR family regulator